MRFSIWPDAGRPWTEIAELAAHCDATGWDGLYVADHFMPDHPEAAATDGPVLECWALAAALAAITTQVRIGTLVSSVTYRHPAVVAKAAATVDHISDGRFVLGLGAGWQLNEHRAYGIELGDVRTRIDRFIEGCDAVASLLHQPRTDLHGEHYQLTDAPCDPKPVQSRLPLLIGGRGEQRTMRLAARLADEWNAWCTADEFRHKRSVLDARCDEIGRDPGAVAGSTQALLYLSDDQAWLDRHRAGPAGRPQLLGGPAEVIEQLAAYEAAGVREFIVPDWTMGPIQRRKDTCDRFITEVASALR